jgi:hypothetical protein
MLAEGTLLITREPGLLNMKYLREHYLLRAADFLEKLVMGRFSESAYRRHITSTRRHVDLGGLGSIPHYTPKFGEVYIDVALVSRPPGTVQPGILDKEPFSSWSGCVDREGFWLITD